MRHSVVGGERLVSAMELKLRVQELQWSCSNTNNWLYSVALFVGRLGSDEALTLSQLRQLVTSAIRFSVSRLGAVDTASASPRSSPVKQRPSRIASFSPVSSLRGADELRSEPASVGEGGQERQDDSVEGLLSGADPEQEQINVITSMLMMIPKPFVVASPSPGKRSGPSSPTKLSQTAEAKGLPKLRIPGQNSANSSALNSPEASDRPAPAATWKTRQSIKRSESAEEEAGLESKVTMEALEDALGSVNFNIADDVSIDVVATLVGQVESPSSAFQSKLKTLGTKPAESTNSPGNEVLARSLPANYKPIRSAFHSLAWSASHLIQKIDFALGSAESIYARDSEGVLLVLHRAAGNTIEEAEMNEKKQARKSIRKSAAAISKRKSIEGSEILSGGGNGAKDDAKAKLGALFSKRAPPSADEGDDPRAKLNALFSKPGGGGLKLGGPLGGNGGSGAAKGGSGPVWGTDIPFPPPIPTSWPPEPYTAESAEASAGADGAAMADGSGVITSTIVNADGTVVTIATPAPAGPPKPKLKQIYLVSLPSIEGTLWADEGEALISVSLRSSFILSYLGALICLLLLCLGGRVI